MIEYDVGPLIKRMRKQGGIKQSVLSMSSGVSRTTIYELENGKKVISAETIRILLKSLGYDPNWVLNDVLRKKQDSNQSIIDEMDGYLSKNQIAEADELIKKLEKNKKFLEEKQNEQYLLFAKAMNCSNSGGDFETVLNMLTDAIKISVANFIENNIEQYFFSNQSIRIINFISTLHFENKNYDIAIGIQMSLKQNFDRNIFGETYKGKHYPTIIYNLTKYLIAVENYEDAIELCNIGCDYCIKIDSYDLMFDIAYNKACCFFELGNIEECKVLIRNAYYASKLFKRCKNERIIQDFARKNLCLEFE